MNPMTSRDRLAATLNHQPTDRVCVDCPAGTFWLYAVICVLGFIFICFKLPETKGKTLEQIERELVD